MWGPIVLYEREIARVERLPAVVMAAGSSSRMGRPKPLLPIGGRPCLERVMDAFREAGQGPIVLVLGSDPRRILAGIRLGPDTVLVLNRHWKRGQTSSVKAGMRAASPAAPGIFVMPGDHPLLMAEDVATLVKRFQARPAGKSVFIPTWKGRRGHPLLLGAGHRQAILGMDDSVPLHAHLRMRAPSVEPVEAAGPGVILGMNTAQEYREALEAAAREPGPGSGEGA